MRRSPIGNDSQTPIVASPISKFEHLLQRLQPEKVQAMIEESKVETATAPAADTNAAAPSVPQDSGDALALNPLAPTCTIEDFAKVDLRVARIIKAEEVPEAKKLVKLTVSLGGDKHANRFCRHQSRIHSGTTPRAIGGDRSQPAAETNEVRVKRRDGYGGRGGGTEVYLLGVDSVQFQAIVFTKETIQRARAERLIVFCSAFLFRSPLHPICK